MAIYFNNAATTYPKPPTVLAAVERALREVPAEAGRGSGGADPAALCRAELARLFAVPDPRQVILAPSATYAANLVLFGLLSGRGGSRVSPVHVVTTVLEHNSILRPLEHLRDEGRVVVSHVKPRDDGRIEPADVFQQLRRETALLAVTHMSNVTGAVQPVEQCAALAAARGIPLLIDAAQSAGAIPLSWNKLPGRVFVVFSGHKGLYGPTGTGGLLVPDAELPPTFVGGTGVLSESRLQPERLPLRYEAGTPNLPGIAGLCAGVRFVLERGVAQLGQTRHRLVQRLRDGLACMPAVRLAPRADADGRGGIVSFAAAGWTAGELSYALLESFTIHTRAGLHCAPRAHATLGLPADGSVRVSVGAFNTAEEVEALLRAVGSLVERGTTVGASCVV
jgi:cysteine desulfurase family protein